MAKHNSFTFRMNNDDRKKLELLAKMLRRSQADTLRLLVDSALVSLERDRTKNTNGGKDVTDSGA